MKDFLVIALGADENAYSVARLVHECYGERALLLCSRRLRATKYTKICDIECVEALDDPNIFVDTLCGILKEKKKEYGKLLVIPCSDYYTHLVAGNYEKFGGLIANKFYTKDLMERMYKKDKFYELCEQYGIEYPKTYVITKENRFDPPFIGKMDFPYIMKPDNSNSTEYLHCEFDGKKKVYYLKSYDEYFEVMKALDKSDFKGNMLVQDFIRGNDSAMRVMNCYSDADHNVRVAVLGQVVLEEYAPSMLGNSSAIISRNIPEVEEKICKFLKDIGYVGFSNIDMKYDATKNKYYVLEINPRLARTSFFLHNAGINMIKTLVDDVVYGVKAGETLHSQKTGLWSSVPGYVLNRYIADPKLREEVKKLYKNSESTLFYKPDNSPKRKYIVSRIYYGYIKSYKKYFFVKPE